MRPLKFSYWWAFVWISIAFAGSALAIEPSQIPDAQEIKRRNIELLKILYQTPEYLPGTLSGGTAGLIADPFGEKKNNYDQLYYSAIDQENFARRCAHFSELFLQRGDTSKGKKYVDLGYDFAANAVKTYKLASDVWMGVVNSAAVQVKIVQRGAAVATNAIIQGLAPSIPPSVLDGIFLGAEFISEYYIEGVPLNSAARNAIIDAILTYMISYQKIDSLGGKTIQDAVLDKEVGKLVGKMGPEIDSLVVNPETKKAIIEALGRVAAEASGDIYKEILKNSPLTDSISGPYQIRSQIHRLFADARSEIHKIIRDAIGDIRKSITQTQSDIRNYFQRARSEIINLYAQKRSENRSYYERNRDYAEMAKKEAILWEERAILINREWTQENELKSEASAREMDLKKKAWTREIDLAKEAYTQEFRLVEKTYAQQQQTLNVGSQENDLMGEAQMYRQKLVEEAGIYRQKLLEESQAIQHKILKSTRKER